MKIPFSPPDITRAEVEEVAQALLSGWITTGPRTKALERQIADYCGTSRAVCLNSATACLELILRTLGIGPGDEVITTAYTYTATASVVCHVGAKLVLVDVAPNSFEMDYSRLSEAITERTKAIIAVDLGGVICDYGAIFKAADDRRELFHPQNTIQQRIQRVAVIADAAHAFGAQRDGKKCGQIADFTSFSFHAVKNFTTAEGGALTWRDLPGMDNDQLYQQFMLLSLHGQSKDALSKNQAGSWEYDIISPAYKCNMTDIAAAIGLVQMQRYPQMLSRRKEIIEKYNQEFSSLNLQILQHFGKNYASSGHLYLVRLLDKTEKDRNKIISTIAERGVATNVHYKPLPLLTAYKNLGFQIGDYPNAFNMYQNEITLPLYSRLTDAEVDYICDVFKESLH